MSFTEAKGRDMDSLSINSSFTLFSAPLTLHYPFRFWKMAIVKNTTPPGPARKSSLHCIPSPQEICA
jgi:hypothetical protein